MRIVGFILLAIGLLAGIYYAYYHFIVKPTAEKDKNQNNSSENSGTNVLDAFATSETDKTKLMLLAATNEINLDECNAFCKRNLAYLFAPKKRKSCKDDCAKKYGNPFLSN